MIALMINDGYFDLVPDYPYEIDILLSGGYIKLKHNPRRYRARCFDIYHKGNKLTFEKAYKLYKIQRTFGMVVKSER